MDAWNARMTKREKFCEAVLKAFQYLAIIAMVEGLLFMSIVLS